MISKREVILLLCISMLNTAVAYAQVSFTILGSGNLIRDGDSLYLSYKTDGHYILQRTASVGNTFTFQGSVNSPVKASIYRNENPEQVNIVTQNVEIYLEGGIITINSPDTLTGAVIGGTGLNDTLQLLRNELAGLREKSRAVKDPELFTEAEKRDTAFVSYNKKVLEDIFYKMADVELAFAEKYPNSYVSLDILVNRSRINSYINKVAAIYDRLAENLKQTPQGAVINERIKKKRQVVVGMTAIDVALTDPTGKVITLSDYKGQYVLLDFWASWCGPCREEHPNLINIYQKYKGKNFTILSVSIDTNKENWTKAIGKDKLLWAQVSDLQGDKGEVYLKYGITSIPANFLIDPNGKVIAKDLKGDALQSELSNIFQGK